MVKGGCRSGRSAAHPEVLWDFSPRSSAWLFSLSRLAEREAPIIEAQRKEAHAKWMSEWRANLRERQKQIARNRRVLERRQMQPLVADEPHSLS